MGFTANRKDPCVFNKLVRIHQLTVCLYVDDLLVTCTDAVAMQDLHRALCSPYGAVTLNEGKVHSYLGQTFNFCSKRECRITMDSYVSEVLESERVDGSLCAR
jgi:hypothetical protein